MKNQCFVVAFDPGQTTGWCVLGVEAEVLNGARAINDNLQNHLIVKRYGEIQCLGPQNGWDSVGAAMENDGVQEMIDIVNEYSINNNKGPIVFEDFIIDFNQITKTRSALSPVTVMAKFEMGFATFNYGNSDHPRCYESDLGRIFRQNRSPVKTTMTDDRLKYFGLYDSHSGQHARDAMRHAYYFLRNCRGNSVKAKETRWRAWPHLFSDPLSEEIKNNYYRTQERRKGTRIDRLG